MALLGVGVHAVQEPAAHCMEVAAFRQRFLIPYECRHLIVQLIR
jgi:hypothetical protein